MNMKRYQPYLTALLMLLVAGSTAGCFDELVEQRYDGPPKSQFFPTSGAVVDGSGVIDLNVQLIGPHQTEATEIPVTVVDTGGLTTASPDNYELLTETFEIPADSSFGSVRVDVQPGGIAPGETETLTLALEESTDGEIAPATNFRFFTLAIAGREAAVSIDPTSITFDSTEVGMTVTDTVEIKNDGNRETEISGLAVVDDTSNSFMIAEAPPTPFTLEAGDSTNVFVEFTPSETGVLGAQLSFAATNDPDTESLALGLEGTGVSEDMDGDTSFDEFDADASGDLDADEFGTAVGESGAFGTFDADAGGDIDEDEFNVGLFDAFDENDDDGLTEGEFNAGRGPFFGGNAEATFANFDANDDATLTQAEFSDGITATGVDTFANFDASADGTLTEAEFSEGSFVIADADESGGVDEEEFDVFSPFFGL